jgi:signal transduction histidine kinase
MNKIYIILLLLVSANGFCQKDDKEYERLLDQLKEARELKNNSELGDAYYRMAIYEEDVNKNSEVSFDYFTRAKQYYEREKNEDKLNKINRIIARRYNKSGFRNESLELFKGLIDYYKSKKDDSTLAYIYFEVSQVYKNKGEHDKALNAINKSIALNKIIKDTSLIIDVSFEKIENHLKLNESDSALITAGKLFLLSAKIKDNVRISKSLYYIGYVNYLRKNYTNAIKYLNESLATLTPVPYDEERRKIYKLISIAYAKNSMHKEAYNYSVRYNNLNDSVLNNDRIKSINDLTIKHKSDEKEKEFRMLEIENKSVLQTILMTRNSLYFVGAGCLALLFALYYVIRFYTQKIGIEKIINDQQHEIDVQKIRELEDNMKIASMQSMIVGQEKERERIATDLHDSLGGLLSAVKLQFDHVKAKLNGHLNLDQYQKATNLLDTAVEEVRNISRNLQPGALKDLGLVSAIKDLINRFDGENYPEIYFQYYNLEDRIDEMSALSIYRIIQELITNTIKHAAANEILIQITKEGEEIVIEYEDDGKGLNLEKLKRKGMGLENINSRVNYLKGSISVNSKQNEGVSYLIRIPYNASVQVKA